VTFRPSLFSIEYLYADLDVSSFVAPIDPNIDNALGTAIAVRIPFYYLLCRHIYSVTNDLLPLGV
jgi:hypothetical protein